MSIQTRNKRKDWQPGPEQKAHKVVCLRPLSGHLETTKWALRDQASGIDRPWNGHSLPILRALSAQSFRRFLGTSCGSATSLLCIMLYDDFVMLLGCFCDNFMPISWYFDDTSCKGIKKASFLYIITYQTFISESTQKDDTMILFSEKLR